MVRVKDSRFREGGPRDGASCCESMNHVLLIGAGFSRNWGGCLAREFRGRLLRLLPEEDLNKLLRDTPNFEDALSRVQADYKQNKSDANKQRLYKVQSAILKVFEGMTKGFVERGHIEFLNHKQFSVIEFLSRFHAIFSLNQDLLLELYYDPQLCDKKKFPGAYWPGMQVPHNFRGAPPYEKPTFTWHPTPEFKLEKNLQPIYKLHGSANWRDDAGEILVMGGAKEAMISEKRILSWYREEFERILMMPETRLMVIGYSFCDQHIDRVIYDAWKNRGLRMFMVHPRGLEVLVRQTPNQIRVPDPLTEIPSLGESLRPLHTTFAGDADELGNLLNFFEG